MEDEPKKNENVRNTNAPSSGYHAAAAAGAHREEAGAAEAGEVADEVRRVAMRNTTPTHRREKQTPMAAAITMRLPSMHPGVGSVKYLTIKKPSGHVTGK